MQLEGPTADGLMYSDTGGDGPVVALLHGVRMGGSLWNTVVEGLGDRYRCVVPELPFGAHTTPMPDDADLSRPVGRPEAQFRLRSDIDLQSHRIGVLALGTARPLMRDLASGHGEKRYRRSTIQEMCRESTGRG